MKIFQVSLIVTISMITISLTNACVSRGRFPNENDSNCQSYIICIDRGTDGFVQYSLRCPTPFIFSPIEGLCTNASSFECKDYLNYKCPKLGNFEHTTQSCSKYIACFEKSDGSLAAVEGSCPKGSSFDKAGGKCVPGDTCGGDADDHGNTELHNSAESTSLLTNYLALCLLASLII